MRAHTRIGALAGGVVFSLLLLSLFLRSSSTTRLAQPWPLSALDSAVSLSGDAALYAQGGKAPSGGLRMVVFGDSWVDDPNVELDVTNKDRGQSWPQLLCKELQCSSYLNFAAPVLHDATEGQVGAVVSNELASEVSNITHMMPDFPTQLTTYLAFPPPEEPTEVVVVVSFGIWDVYKYASLPRDKAAKKIEDSLTSFIAQLDILHSYLSVTHKWEVANEEQSPTQPSSAVVIVPRLFDPTFLPGWTSRPWPKSVVSDAEQMKDTVYLAERWNAVMEEKLRNWVRTGTQAPVSDEHADTQAHVPGAPSDIDRDFDRVVGKPGKRRKRSLAVEERSASKGDADDGGGEYPPTTYDKTKTDPKDLFWKPWEKEVYFLDLPQVIVDSIREQQLTTSNITDAEGLGTNPSPYISVQQPCLVPRRMGELKARAEALANDEGELVVSELISRGSSSQDVCAEPDKYLFWDDWHVGPRAHMDIASKAFQMLQAEHKIHD